MQVEQMYQEIILDHYKNPHGQGLREPFDAETHHVNPTCGDELTVRVKLEHDGDATRLADISYTGQGCSISQASMSVAHELLAGNDLGRALEITEQFREMVSSRGEIAGDEDVLGDAVAFAGVAKYPARVKCALLGWMAVKDAAAQAGAAEVDGAPTSEQPTTSDTEAAR